MLLHFENGFDSIFVSYQLMTSSTTARGLPATTNFFQPTASIRANNNSIFITEIMRNSAITSSSFHLASMPRSCSISKT